MAGELSRRTSLSQLARVTDTLFHGNVRTQYAAICHRQNSSDGSIEVLLITSRDSGRWVIPKGWPMRKKKPHEVARQEAWEEAGVRGRVRKKVWGHYTYMKKLDDGDLVPAVVQVHLLDVAQMENDFPERDQRRLAWFRPSIAALAVEEPELSGLITKLDLLDSDERRLRRIPEPSR
ncbi:NUDIX hydrolase [Rhizobium sp. CG5]|uniref:NUDIX hydrolase n=1 Tax=Rhizobium sp. CG5 TaxID=2726076 RepID=UPI0020337632|nr:NUDIX hydrolase [Rhizobium sp. CG5]MCM2476787.1 NUDIX hydrolase [Rhizobium sp. CG5]